MTELDCEKRELTTDEMTAEELDSMTGGRIKLPMNDFVGLEDCPARAGLPRLYLRRIQARVQAANKGRPFSSGLRTEGRARVFDPHLPNFDSDPSLFRRRANESGKWSLTAGAEDVTELTTSFPKYFRWSHGRHQDCHSPSSR